MRHGITEAVFATFPNQTIAIDIVGPLNETSAGNFWILTMIDVFTRWPVAIPIANRESKLIMQTIFDHWICQKGVPSTIVSDQGRELISRGVKSLCVRMGIRKIQTSGYNPTGNASVERFHRFLMASLSILHKKTLVEWDELLPSVLFAYRASQNDTTGYSPFFLETGRRPTLPLGCLVGNFDQPDMKNDAEWVVRLKNSLQQAFSVVRESQIEVARKNKE